jgi:hypothetical protein
MHHTYNAYSNTECVNNSINNNTHKTFSFCIYYVTKITKKNTILILFGYASNTTDQPIIFNSSRDIASETKLESQRLLCTYG